VVGSFPMPPPACQTSMSRSFPLALLASITAACCCLVSAPVLAQQAGYAVEITVPKDYRQLLEDHLDIIKWRDNPHLDSEQFRQIAGKTPDSIRELLATEGYFSPQVTSSLEEKQGQWQARFTVDPGLPVRVSGFDLKVTGAFADGSPENDARLQKIRAQLPLQPGMVFRQEDWENAKRTALTALLIQRYPTAAIASSLATVNPDTRQAELSVVLDSGPAFTFGGLQINGLKRYPRSIVERLNKIVPGSPYSQSSLLDFQAQLQNTPYFSTVLVSIKTDPAAPTEAPVQVDLVEKPSRKIGLGLGASTNTGARGQIEYQNMDFLGRAWHLTSLLKLETKSKLLNGLIQVPRTPYGYLDSANIFTGRDDIEGVITTKYGVGAKRSRVTGKIETALETQYQTEKLNTAGIESIQQRALTLNYTWTRRSVDNALYPTRGLMFSAQIGGAAKALLSSTDFVRSYAKLVYFYPLAKRSNLILRGELGAVTARSREGVPSDFMFRAGGDQSVRGYAYQSLGVNVNGAVLGGRYLGVGSADYVQWLSPRWGAAVFYDTGDAADDPQSFKLVHGYGTGLRWKSPVGPLNLDLAYGREARQVRLHFSVGFAF
jgi:translocation and assembly module TamA